MLSSNRFRVAGSSCGAIVPRPWQPANRQSQPPDLKRLPTPTLNDGMRRKLSQPQSQIQSKFLEADCHFNYAFILLDSAQVNWAYFLIDRFGFQFHFL